MSMHRRAAAFTLLEVLVAVAVLAVGFVGVLQVVAQCQTRSRDNRDRAEALRLAESKINELSVQSELEPGMEEGDFGDENSRFSWQQRIEETETEGLLRLTVTVNWRNGVREQGVDLSTCVAPGALNTGSSGEAAAGEQLEGSPSSSSSSPLPSPSSSSAPSSGSSRQPPGT